MRWWGHYRLEQCVSSSFPNAASANKRGAGSNFCPCWLGRGCEDSTGKDNSLYYHFQMQLLQTRVEIFRGAGSDLCPSWLGTGWWGKYRTGQCVISSFPNAASANKSEQVVISAPVGWEGGGGDITA
jgi:hypothetical protein